MYYDIYQTDPNDLTAVKSYAGILLGVDRADESVAILEQFTPKPEEEFNYYAIYAAANFNAKRFEAARGLYEILMEMRPDLADFQYSLASCYQKLKMWDEARQLYTNLQRLFPGKSKPWNQMGYLELQVENFDRALEEFTIAKVNFEHEEDEEAIDRTLFVIATCYRKLKRWSEAREVYTLLQSRLPDSGEPWKQMGLLKYETKEFKGAMEDLTIAKGKFEVNENEKGINDCAFLIDEVDWIYAKSYMSRGEFDIACPQLNSLRLRNDMVRYGFDTAICYREAGLYDTATTIFSDLVQQNPDNTVIFVEFCESIRRHQRVEDSDPKRNLIAHLKKNGYTSPKIASLLALVHLTEGNERKALKALQKARKYNDPEKPPLAQLFIAANAYKSLGKNEEANALIKEAQELAPDLFGSHTELFKIIPATKNHGEFQLILTALYNESGLDPMVRMKRANLHLGGGNFEKVLPDCETVQNDETLPDDAYEKRTAKALKQAARIEIARGLFESGAKEEAVAMYYDIYQTDPNDLTAVKSYAGILLGVDRADESVAILEQFSPKPEEEFNYYAIYAAANFNAKRFQPALNSFKLLIKMRPDLTEFQYSLGNCYRKLKQWSEARALYSALQSQFPEDGEPWKQMGLLEYELAAFDKAVEELTIAKIKFELADDEKGSRGSQDLVDEVKWIEAKTLMSKGDFDTACPSLDKLRLKSDMLRYGFDTAICYREAEEYYMATVIFTELVQQNPENTDLFIAFTENIGRHRDVKSSREHLESFVTDNGYSSQKLVSLLAMLYLDVGNPQKALNALSKFRPYLESDKIPLFHLFIEASAHEQLGNMEKTKSIQKMAQEQAPDLLTSHTDLFNLTLGSKNRGEAQLILSALYSAKGLTHMVRMKRASLQLSAENWEKVLDDSLVVLEDETLAPNAIEGGTATALLQEAKIALAGRLYVSGKTYEAVDLYRDVYFANPDSRNSINLGFFVSTIGESHRTDTIMRGALSKDPTNMGIYQVWSEVLLSEHRAPEIMDLLELNVGKDHIYQMGLSELMVKSLMELGRWDDIAHILDAIKDQSIQTTPGGPQTIGELPDALVPIQAMFHQQAGDFDSSLQTWKILTNKFPEVSAYQLEIALLYKSVKDFETTGVLFAQLLQDFPEDVNIWKQYAGFLISQKDEEGAQDAYQKALTLLVEQEPEDFWPHVQWQMDVGSMYFSMGELEMAEKSLLKLSLQVPYYFPTYNVLGFLYLEMKDYYKAEIAFKRALELQPNNPFLLQSLTQTFMKNRAPAQSRHWEAQSVPKMPEFKDLIPTLKSSSLGVFGYRPVPWMGTLVDFTQLSVRPNAMMLVRESAFSDAPLAGFQIDQKVFKQQIGLFAPELPAVWFNFTHVNSSNSLDVVANLMEVQGHHTLVKKMGTTHIYPSFKYLLENEKFAETKARPFPMGSLRVEFIPARTSITVAGDTAYGVQRLDKYGLPTEFFVGTLSAARAAGTQSAFTSATYRTDKLPSGDKFTSIITETALGTSIWKIKPSILYKSEYITGLPKVGSALGHVVMGSLTSSAILEHFVPFSSYTIARSPQYELKQTNAAEIGLSYGNGVMLKTQEQNRWYKYKIPYLIKASYQRNWYPNSTIPTSQTLFLNIRII